MSKQGDAAYAWFLKGYNCSQSVVAAFAPQLGLTEEMALRLSSYSLPSDRYSFGQRNSDSFTRIGCCSGFAMGAC